MKGNFGENRRNMYMYNPITKQTSFTTNKCKDIQQMWERRGESIINKALHDKLTRAPKEQRTSIFLTEKKPCA